MQPVARGAEPRAEQAARGAVVGALPAWLPCGRRGRTAAPQHGVPPGGRSSRAAQLQRAPHQQAAPGGARQSLSSPTSGGGGAAAPAAPHPPHAGRAVGLQAAPGGGARQGGRSREQGRGPAGPDNGEPQPGGRGAEGGGRGPQADHGAMPSNRSAWEEPLAGAAYPPPGPRGGAGPGQGGVEAQGRPWAAAGPQVGQRPSTLHAAPRGTVSRGDLEAFFRDLDAAAATATAEEAVHMLADCAAARALPLQPTLAQLYGALLYGAGSLTPPLLIRLMASMADLGLDMPVGWWGAVAGPALGPLPLRGHAALMQRAAAAGGGGGGGRPLGPPGGAMSAVADFATNPSRSR
jgi:hypothetical protein